MSLELVVMIANVVVVVLKWLDTRVFLPSCSRVSMLSIVDHFPFDKEGRESRVW
jgi:hypothetical protein